MSHTYKAITWNRQKGIYDLVVLTGVVAYVGAFIVSGAYLHPTATIESLLIRALGTCAFLFLNVTLAVGPMARIWPGLRPLLYNRRHLGVITFFLALAHGSLATFQFHALGNINPLVSLLASNIRIDSIAHFPFELLGLVALLILLVMAVTSHDFWLSSLTPPIWKSLHMCVYVAYVLVVAHILLGALQSERSPFLVSLVAAGVATLVALHLTAGFHERRLDLDALAGEDGMIDVCHVDEIGERRAKIVCVSGERVAIFRYDGMISAISNVCRHQNGPLGEGRIIDGCVTCPWHGYQYRPESGAAPPPYLDKVAPFRTQVRNGRVKLDPKAEEPGTFVEPARIGVESLT